MITFLNPLYFLFLVPIIFLLILLYFKGGKKIYFGDNSIFKKVFNNNSIFYKTYFILIFFIFLFFTSILSTPVIENVLEKNTKKGIDIQIVLDISYSMIAEDLEPNRLDVAKDVIEGFLEKIENDRVGIVVFAGKTFTSLPLSFDYNIIRKVLSKISVKTINQNYINMQGTAVGDALLHAGESFKDKERNKVIILLTDGEANKGLNPITSVLYLKDKIDSNIKIYTIGIGSNNESFIKIIDMFGREHEMKIAAVDENTLKQIANLSNGKYFRATDKETLTNIFNEISKIEKTEIETEVIKINIHKYNYFLYILILFFMGFLFLKYRKKI